MAGISTSILPANGLASDVGQEMVRVAPEKLQSGKVKKIIVAGAGITGLCCAYELMKKGHDVVVLEANRRHGGHVYTGTDGLSNGFYTDYGADHITKPGYEKFFGYVKEFDLSVLDYPHAEGSAAAPDRNGLTMIDSIFYTDEMLSDPPTLRKLGFSQAELQYLTDNHWDTLSWLYITPHLDKFIDPFQPFGVGLDNLDTISVHEFYKTQGASETALRFLGGKGASALYVLWRSAVHRSRGIPISHGDTYRLKGGNQMLPNVFAEHLGPRIKLDHPVKTIRQEDSGVTVTYTAYGNLGEMEMKADFLVNCITFPVFRNIPITPELSPDKRYVVDHLSYSSHPFYVFEASSRFWLEDGYKSINMNFEHPDISMIWEESYNQETGRVVLKAYCPGGLSPQRVLAAFRELYPGKKDTIYQALTFDWTKDKYAPACEMEPFPIGELHRFWPQILKAEGRIFFAGTYADVLSRGMESCLRSAQRVANEINEI